MTERLVVLVTPVTLPQLHNRTTNKSVLSFLSHRWHCHSYTTGRLVVLVTPVPQLHDETTCHFGHTVIPKTFVGDNVIIAAVTAISSFPAMCCRVVNNCGGVTPASARIVRDCRLHYKKSVKNMYILPEHSHACDALKKHFIARLSHHFCSLDYVMYFS